MEHHCEGGYGVTNFKADKLHIYLRAISEFNSDQMWISNKTMGGYCGYCLCCTNALWRSKDGLSQFWRIVDKYYKI